MKRYDARTAFGIRLAVVILIVLLDVAWVFIPYGPNEFIYSMVLCVLNAIGIVFVFKNLSAFGDVSR